MIKFFNADKWLRLFGLIVLIVNNALNSMQQDNAKKSALTHAITFYNAESDDSVMMRSSWVSNSKTIEMGLNKPVADLDRSESLIEVKAEQIKDLRTLSLYLFWLARNQHNKIAKKFKREKDLFKRLEKILTILKFANYWQIEQLENVCLKPLADCLQERAIIERFIIDAAFAQQLNVSYDCSTKVATLIAIPRDLWINPCNLFELLPTPLTSTQELKFWPHYTFNNGCSKSVCVEQNSIKLLDFSKRTISANDNPHKHPVKSSIYDASLLNFVTLSRSYICFWSEQGRVMKDSHCQSIAEFENIAYSACGRFLIILYDDLRINVYNRDGVRLARHSIWEHLVDAFLSMDVGIGVGVVAIEPIIGDWDARRGIHWAMIERYKRKVVWVGGLDFSNRHEIKTKDPIMSVAFNSGKRTHILILKKTGAVDIWNLQSDNKLLYLVHIVNPALIPEEILHAPILITNTENELPCYQSFMAVLFPRLKLTADATMLLYYILQRMVRFNSSLESIDFSSEKHMHLQAYFKLRPFRKLHEYVKFVNVSPKSFNLLDETIIL